jgi:hypothetical protein
LFGFSFFLVHYFSEWEQTGGERSVNTILYGLYMLLGKWGVAALLWLGSAALVWQGLKKRQGGTARRANQR